MMIFYPIDQLMMDLQFYHVPAVQNSLVDQTPIAKNILQCFQQLCRLDTVLTHAFLPLQPLMESFDEFCFSAAQFLDPAVYRIVSLFYRE